MLKKNFISFENSQKKILQQFFFPISSSTGVPLPAVGLVQGVQEGGHVETGHDPCGLQRQDVGTGRRLFSIRRIVRQTGGHTRPDGQ